MFLVLSKNLKKIVKKLEKFKIKIQNFINSIHTLKKIYWLLLFDLY